MCASHDRRALISATTVPLPRPKSAADSISLDQAIMLTASGLMIIGLVMNLSASSVWSASRTGSAFTFFLKQLLGSGLGLAALVAGARIDYRRLRPLAFASVPVIWVALLFVLVAGSSAYGASRWIVIGPISVQPSEAAKLVMVVFGAEMLSRTVSGLSDWRHLLPFGLPVMLTAGLILMQPDFGTMTIVVGTSMVMAFLAGAPMKHLGALSGMGILVGIPAMLMEGYRRERLFSFLNRSTDALNSGWQSNQGLVALGTGGWWGMGLGSSRQKWGYLPNAHTDFIFAILGEETGLLGTMTVVALFAILAWLGIQTARRAPDAFGFLLAAGVTAWISLQVLINVGAVTGLLPITGVPLPLISYGGTSLTFTLAGLGLVASVARHSKPSRKRAR